MGKGGGWLGSQWACSRPASFELPRAARRTLRRRRSRAGERAKGALHYEHAARPPAARARRACCSSQASDL
eukprot:scaffold102157_cov60-Phaeocystis_antarctica.AAC.1